MTAMMRTFTSEPSTGTPDQVLNRANIEKINVTASSSFWRMGRFMQQFAEQADADKEKETDQH